MPRSARVSVGRRSFLVGAAGASIAVSLGAPRAQQGVRRVAALFAGRIDDRGFMQAGYAGLQLAAAKVGVSVSYKDGVRPEKDLLADALRELAATKPDLVIAHGGQNNAAAQLVAHERHDIPFVVTQGNVRGSNLSSYEVLQEHSAFLAGALAALTTKTGVVGHMSGIRVTPGLKGRAAFANGVRHVNPDVKLLTNFSGNQDDNLLSKRVAAAMIAEGADVIFTMLNAGRIGAVEACRERGVSQIGNVGDWTKIAPDVFIASAVADSGLALFNAARDMALGAFRPGIIRQIGLEQPDAVRLTMADRVGADVRSRIDALGDEIASRKLEVSTEWTGAEFDNPA